MGSSCAIPVPTEGKRVWLQGLPRSGSSQLLRPHAKCSPQEGLTKARSRLDVSVSIRVTMLFFRVWAGKFYFDDKAEVA
jgi:hypothetical protein